MIFMTDKSYLFLMIKLLFLSPEMSIFEPIMSINVYSFVKTVSDWAVISKLKELIERTFSRFELISSLNF